MKGKNKRIKQRASMQIEYIFLILLGVITVFIIVGILTKWTFGADKFVSSMTKGDTTPTDIQIIKTHNIEQDKQKHLILCAEKCKAGQFTDLCYILDDGSNKVIIRCNKQEPDNPIVE